jgi:hypothetical protein
MEDDGSGDGFKQQFSTGENQHTREHADECVLLRRRAPKNCGGRYRAVASWLERAQAR